MSKHRTSGTRGPRLGKRAQRLLARLAAGPVRIEHGWARSTLGYRTETFGRADINAANSLVAAGIAQFTATAQERINNGSHVGLLYAATLDLIDRAPKLAGERSG